MKKKFKKLSFIFLALILTFGSTIFAYADDDRPRSKGDTKDVGSYGVNYRMFISGDEKDCFAEANGSSPLCIQIVGTGHTRLCDFDFSDWRDESYGFRISQHSDIGPFEYIYAHYYIGSYDGSIDFEDTL